MDSAVLTKVVHKDSAYEEDMELEQCRLREYGQGRLREYGLCKLREYGQCSVDFESKLRKYRSMDSLD
jgi:hypothetical protein